MEQDVELVMLLEANERQSIWQQYRYGIQHGGYRRLVNLAVFAGMQKVEARLVAIANRRFRNPSTQVDVEKSQFTETIRIVPVFSNNRLRKRYSSQDVQRIEEAKLDIIVCGSGGAIPRGEILAASRLGLISLHHGDNRWNRGEAPGFWEVYKKKSATGFIIQIISDKLNAGGVVFRGALATKRTFSENIQHVLGESNPFLSHTILGLLRGDMEMKFEPKLPIDAPLDQIPSLWVTACYVLKTSGLIARLIVDRKLLNRYPRWSIGYVRDSWREADFSKLNVIKNPRRRFFADPFIVNRDDRIYIFVEDYSYLTAKGTVSCIVIDQEDSIEIIENVLEEEFHLSFPYVFEYEDELYMVPETRADQSIRLYRCVEFPAKWEFEMELMSHVAAADTLVLKHDGKWFLLTNINRYKTSTYHGSQFDVYVSDQLLSTNWKRISNNPTLFDPRCGRNGGVVFDDDGAIFRVRQAQGFNSYGDGTSIARITSLSSTAFEEVEVGSIAPTFKKGIRGTHHLHSRGGVTVIDFVKMERVSR